jgi:hypothetical protein
VALFRASAKRNETPKDGGIQAFTVLVRDENNVTV